MSDCDACTAVDVPVRTVAGWNFCNECYYVYDTNGF